MKARTHRRRSYPTAGANSRSRASGRCATRSSGPAARREWDWNETGTQHEPGIQPADVDELLADDPEVIVLSRGRERRLQTQPQTLAVLQDRNIEVVVEETSVAISTYNRLSSEGRRVAALVHSTC